MNTKDQILDPRSKSLHRWIRCTRPLRRNLVVQEAGVDSLQVLRHDDKTLDRLLDCAHGALQQKLEKRSIAIQQTNAVGSRSDQEKANQITTLCWHSDQRERIKADKNEPGLEMQRETRECESTECGVHRTWLPPVLQVDGTNLKTGVNSMQGKANTLTCLKLHVFCGGIWHMHTFAKPDFFRKNGKEEQAFESGFDLKQMWETVQNVSSHLRQKRKGKSLIWWNAPDRNQFSVWAAQSASLLKRAHWPWLHGAVCWNGRLPGLVQLSGSPCDPSNPSNMQGYAYTNKQTNKQMTDVSSAYTNATTHRQCIKKSLKLKV